MNLRWIKAQGGVKEMERRAIEKADMLYAEIDRNKLFVGTAAKEDRSRMNICFVMAPEYKDLEADFMKFATEKGMVGIKGHRSVGGFRASCYNALPKESVQALIDVYKRQPVDCPLWILAVATAFSVIFAKEVFGGTGMNVFNVALITRAFLFFAYPTKMSGDAVWVSGDTIFGMGQAVDGLTVACLLYTSRCV